MFACPVTLHGTLPLHAIYSGGCWGYRIERGDQGGTAEGVGCGVLMIGSIIENEGMQDVGGTCRLAYSVEVSTLCFSV